MRRSAQMWLHFLAEVCCRRPTGGFPPRWNERWSTRAPTGMRSKCGTDAVQASPLMLGPPTKQEYGAGVVSPRLHRASLAAVEADCVGFGAHGQATPLPLLQAASFIPLQSVAKGAARARDELWSCALGEQLEASPAIWEMFDGIGEIAELPQRFAQTWP